MYVCVCVYVGAHVCVCVLPCFVWKCLLIFIFFIYFGSFGYIAPTVWNLLPADLRAESFSLPPNFQS